MGRQSMCCSCDHGPEHLLPVRQAQCAFKTLSEPLLRQGNSDSTLRTYNSTHTGIQEKTTVPPTLNYYHGQDPGILADSLTFMVKAGSWLTEFVSKEAGVEIDSSEHESSSEGSLAGLSKVTSPGQSPLAVVALLA